MARHWWRAYPRVVLSEWLQSQRFADSKAQEDGMSTVSFIRPRRALDGAEPMTRGSFERVEFGTGTAQWQLRGR